MIETLRDSQIGQHPLTLHRLTKDATTPAGENMRRHLSVLFLILLICTASVVVFATPLTGTESQIQAIGEPLLDNLIKALQEKNYDLYSANLDQLVKESVTAEKFPQVCADIAKKLGTFQSKIFLGSLKQGGNTLILWKARYSAQSDDVLIRLSVSDRDGKYFVTGLWF